jgi:hypothetical protein
VDSLIKAGNSEYAEILCKEIEYTTTNINFFYYSKIYRIEINKRKNNHKKVLEILNEFDLNEINDSLKKYAYFNWIFSYYLLDKIDIAEIKIKELLYSNLNIQIKDMYWLISLVYFDNKDFSSSKKYLNEYLDFLKVKHEDRVLIILKNKADSLFSNLTKLKFKNPQKAEKLSVFFPGLGLIYSKNYKEGITSFLLMGIIAGATATGIYFKYYFTSTVIGSALLGKFHAGIVRRSAFSANKYNYMKFKPYKEFYKDKIILNLLTLKSQ